MHLPTLTRILQEHELQDELEIHLLHRHFSLEEGEIIVHKEMSIDKEPLIEGLKILVDVAKPLKVSENLKGQLTPILWYSARNGNIVPYEYAISIPDDARRAVNKISSKKWSAFTTDFAEYLWRAGLQDLVSLKDKSCISGLEYVAPDDRALFRVPEAIVTLQPESSIIETGWDVAEGKNPQLQMSDGHVTQTRQTTGGTVAVKHVTKRHGAEAFNSKEISTIYTDELWMAVDSKWAPFDIHHQVPIAV